MPFGTLRIAKPVLRKHPLRPWHKADLTGPPLPAEYALGRTKVFIYLASAAAPSPKIPIFAPKQAHG
jgi:hypothetical protein